MVGSFLGWFKTLSLLGKAGVVSAAVVGTSTVAAVTTPPPVVEVKRETKTEQIVYSTTEIKDGSLAIGETKVKTPGQDGTKEVLYEFTYTDGEETNRQFISEEVTNEPITQVVLVGSREVTTETKRENIPYQTHYQNDPNMNSGETKTLREGVAGIKIFTYEVVKTDGKEVERKLVKEEVTEQPVSRLIARGTKIQSNCDPNYTPCVPKVSYDLDCPDIGHSVRVIRGYDPHGFDADSDSYGCESY